MISTALIIRIIIGLGVCGVFIFYFCVFFDQAILTRKGTVYRVKTLQKKIALTFDDGPSLSWTPKILDELKKSNVKATFFMIGHHVKKYPQVARRVAQEGHEIENHGYAHSVLVYYTPEELEEEIRYTELVIKEITGQTTSCFRPPKAWLRRKEKEKISSMGYKIVLWSLNSKDWVPFNSRHIVKYISKNIRNGDIILLHDSGDVFKAEGGDRMKTVLSIPLLADELRSAGFEFVTVKELLSGNGFNATT